MQNYIILKKGSTGVPEKYIQSSLKKEHTVSDPQLKKALSPKPNPKVENLSCQRFILRSAPNIMETEYADSKC